MTSENRLPKITDYTYDLPDEKIAKHPLESRDASKLLVYRHGEIIDEKFVNCIHYIPENSLVIFNNTRVIHARILMQKATGAHIEILCLEPFSPRNYEQSFAQIRSVSWKCVVGNAKKWKNEPLEAIIPAENPIHFTAIKGETTEDGFVVTFSWDSNQPFSEILELIGKVPIPPYLNRETEEIDIDRYQTIYAQFDGSVAAPTAGLHFTSQVLEKFAQHNFERDTVTLHVGAGTFKPVKAELYTEHVMHRELCIVSKSLIEHILQKIPNVTAVGTTSVRTLESLYWLGVKLVQNPKSDISFLSQWEAYELPQNVSVETSLRMLVKYMNINKINEIQYYTQIMITPSYQFKLVRSMFTNFHQPQSTLLLLISSFVGDDWRKIYQHALENNYRFLSYGDSSLLIP